jgi:hypothetical protein
MIGAFLFEHDLAQWTREDAAPVLARLADVGVDTIVTESDTCPPNIVGWVHDAGMRFLAAVACFSDHANANRLPKRRPELWPVDGNGSPVAQKEWFVGVVPTFEDHREDRLALLARLAGRDDVDGVILDFVRWPFHWELECRPGARITATSFDPHTLQQFERRAGVRVPPGEAPGAWIDRHARAEWLSFRTEVITTFVTDAVERAKASRPSIEIGAFLVPLPADELAEVAGQSLAELGRTLDLVCPMAYHAILHRTPAWVADIVADHRAASSAPVVPVLQADSAGGAALGADWGPPVTANQWSDCLAAASDAGARSIIVFPGLRLLDEGHGGCLAASSFNHRKERRR